MLQIHTHYNYAISSCAGTILRNTAIYGDLLKKNNIKKLELITLNNKIHIANPPKKRVVNAYSFPLWEENMRMRNKKMGTLLGKTYTEVYAISVCTKCYAIITPKTHKRITSECREICGRFTGSKYIWFLTTTPKIFVKQYTSFTTQTRNIIPFDML